MDGGIRKRWWFFCLAVGFLMGMIMGCQTWVPEAGVTLPTGHYLRHPPTYIPPSPQFPLPKEVQSLEDANRSYQQSVQGIN